VAKVKYTGGDSGDFMDKPGTPKCRVIAVTDKTENEGLNFVLTLEAVSGDQKGKRVIDYLRDTPTAGWRFAAMLKAVGLPAIKAGAEVDSTRLAKQIQGKLCTVQTFPDTYQGEERIKIKNYILPKEGAAAEEPEPDEPTEAVGVGDDNDEPEVDLAELDRKALKVLIKEQELGIVVTQKMTDDDVRDAIEKALSEPAEEPEPDDDEPAGDEPAGDDEPEPANGDGEDYTTWELQELKDELTTRGLSPRGSKVTLAKRLTYADNDKSDPFAEEE